MCFPKDGSKNRGEVAGRGGDDLKHFGGLYTTADCGGGYAMKGSCLCGAVRYEVTSTPTAFDLDHCSRCRKSSGSAFRAELIFEATEFEWLSGRSLVQTYEAPVRKTRPGYRRTFCTVCGGPLPTVDRDMINVPAGTLDDDRHFARSVTSLSISRLRGSKSSMRCRDSPQNSGVGRFGTEPRWHCCTRRGTSRWHCTIINTVLRTGIYSLPHRQ